VLEEGQDEQSRRRCELAAMKKSQEYATAVALRELEYRIPTKLLGVAVEGTFPGYPAAGKLRSCDWIRAVDGTPVRRAQQVTRALSEKKPGQLVRLRIGRRRPSTVVLRAA
jgi:PDZ domain-containing protein